MLSLLGQLSAQCCCCLPAHPKCLIYCLICHAVLSQINDDESEYNVTEKVTSFGYVTVSAISLATISLANEKLLLANKNNCQQHLTKHYQHISEVTFFTFTERKQLSNLYFRNPVTIPVRVILIFDKQFPIRAFHTLSTTTN